MSQNLKGKKGGIALSYLTAHILHVCSVCYPDFMPQLELGISVRQSITIVYYREKRETKIELMPMAHRLQI